MNDIRNALKKAGLIDERTERRLKHEGRVHRKQVGRDGLAEEAQQHAQQQRERTAQRKQSVKAAQEEHTQARQQVEHTKQLAARIDAEKVRAGGPRRFHYRDPDGFLPYLEVRDDVSRRLEGGELAIVIAGAEQQATIIPRPLAAEVAALQPVRVLFLPGQPR